MPSQKKSGCKITRKDLGVHRVVFQQGGLQDGIMLGYYFQNEKVLEGYKRGDGIMCGCCDSKVSASNFEAHAGFAKRRKPYHHIRTSNGVSLHKFAVTLLKGHEISTENNNDSCSICNNGGELLCCQMCPRTFHLGCLKLSRIPHGKWFCDSCASKKDKSGSGNANTNAAGGVSGLNPIQQITEGCTSIVIWEDDITLCALCRACDYSESGFNPRTVIICDQCEMGFHVSCLKKYEMADLKEKPEGKWFCGKYCQRIFASLEKLLDRGELTIPETLLAPAKKKQDEKRLNISPDLNLKWRLLKGEITSLETEPFSKLVTIFHDCFGPIMVGIGDPLILQMVCGENSEAHKCRGMYCAVLTVNSVVVSTGIFRVFGHGIAELPLVATSKDYQGQGYFQILFSCIMKVLASLKVEKMVLPSAEESEPFWTNKIGFKKIEKQEFKKLKKYCQVITFEDTTMLERRVPKLEELEDNQFKPF